MILLALLACARDPVSLARTVEIPESATARFAARLSSTVPGLEGVHRGGLALGPEGRVRVQVRGPLGGAGLLLLSDGERVALYDPVARETFAAPDADEVLGDVGAGGIATVADLCRGFLPPPPEARSDGDGGATWTGPNATAVRASFSDRGLPERLDVEDGQGLPLLGVRWADRDPAGLPSAIALSLPRIATRVDLDELAWTVAPVDAGLFAAPEGFRVVSGGTLALEAYAAAVHGEAVRRGLYPE